MKFKDALQKSLKADKHTHANPFLLSSRVSDHVGNDYETKKAAEEFYRFDAKYEISKTILATTPQQKRRKRKKHIYKLKPIAPPPDNAYVFFADDSTLHLSGECPCLKNRTVFRTSYDYARYRDYLKHRHSLPLKPHWSYSLAKSHTPQICRRCGSFTPTYPRTFIEKLRTFLYDTFGVGRPIQCVKISFQDVNTM